MEKILITGGCGFIGHHFVEHVVKNTDMEIIVIDKLSYASSGYDRLRDINCFNEKRIRIFPIDLNRSINSGIKQEVGRIDYIVNLASDSHVDNSILEPIPFIKNNINLVLNMLEWAKEIKNLKKFIQFSTDEVYGPAPKDVNYKEGMRHNPTNPYSASKAAQEDICRAFANCYKLPIIITNTMNVMGERQHPEKFIPSTIRKILKGEEVCIHSDSTRTLSGSRFYIHARNVSSALLFLLDNNEKLDSIDSEKGQFNIVGEKEVTNLELAQFIAKALERPLKYEMVDFHSSRPGHDLRYALDGSKMKNLGWKIPKTFEDSLTKTIYWIISPQNIRWIL